MLNFSSSTSSEADSPAWVVHSLAALAAGSAVLAAIPVFDVIVDRLSLYLRYLLEQSTLNYLNAARLILRVAVPVTTHCGSAILAGTVAAGIARRQRAVHAVLVGAGFPLTVYAVGWIALMAFSFSIDEATILGGDYYLAVPVVVVLASFGSTLNPTPDRAKAGIRIVLLAVALFAITCKLLHYCIYGHW